MTQPVITERMSFKQQIIKLLFLYVYKLFHSRLCVWQQIQLQRTFVVVNMGVIKRDISHRTKWVLQCYHIFPFARVMS